MRKLLLSVIMLLLSSAGYAQSWDERIAGSMNAADWFALDSIYSAAPKDSVMPMLEVFSRCLLGNRFNRTDVSVPAFDELFKEHSASLGLDNLLSSTIMFATDLGRVGYHEQAADLAKSILGATGQYLDSAWTESLQQCISKHTALSAYKPYGISFADAVGRIPFRIVPVGEDRHESVLMHLAGSSINGRDADITFDTGAGVNMISDSLAREYDLVPIDGYVTVAGIGQRKGQLAIAKEVRLGNVTVSDVPFVIVDLSTGNATADQYIRFFSIVIGSELMLQLKDLTMDFAAEEITVPSVAPDRSGTAPNMCFGEGMGLHVAGSVLGNPMLMNIDTGDASYGMLGTAFFTANKDFIVANAEPDTIRRGGIGGVVKSLCYRVGTMPVSMGGHTVGVSGLVVDTEHVSTAMNLSCNIGLKTLMMFDKIRFNLVDFVLTTYPRELAAADCRRRDAPIFRYTKDKDPSVLQTLGIIAVGVTRGPDQS